MFTSLTEYIAEKLSQTHIFEMAKSISEYKDLVINMIRPIIAHVILILKSREENDNEFINHWKKELLSFLTEFIDIRLKTKNTYKKKKKYIKDVLINNEEIDTNDKWYLSKLWKKLYEEGYDLSEKNIYDDFLPIIHDFQDNHLDQIIDLIASQDIFKIKAYINNL